MRCTRHSRRRSWTSGTRGRSSTAAPNRPPQRRLARCACRASLAQIDLNRRRGTKAGKHVRRVVDPPFVFWTSPYTPTLTTLMSATRAASLVEERQTMCLNLGRAILALTFALCVATVCLGHAQQPAGTSLGPLSGEPRFFAPFSADAITNILQRTRDGGRFARRVVMRYYRDSFGRVRVEYTPNSTDDSSRTVGLVVATPYARRDHVFLVDDDTKLVELRADFVNLAELFSAARAIVVPTGLRRFTIFPGAEGRYSGNGLVEDLGSRMIGDVRADGSRFTTT